MNKIIAMILCLVLAVSLVACGGQSNTQTTTQATTEATTEATTQATTEAIEMVNYKITVVAEDGTPFAGIVVQLCNDGGCRPQVTDENGTATVPVEEYRDDYHANVTQLPEGYEYASGEVDHYFESGSTELTIVLKAVA